MNSDSRLPPRLGRSLLAGAAVGALTIVVPPSLTGVAAINNAEALQEGLILVSVAFVVAFVFWLLGLFAFGVLPWLILHRNGHRGWLSAILLGFSMTFLIGLGISSHAFGLFALNNPTGFHEQYSDSGGMTEIDFKLTPHGWHNALEFSAGFAAMGVVVALAVWLTAYRPWLRSAPEKEF